MAFWLGFAKGMQYTGLAGDGEDNLPGSTTALTNCFAMTYGLMTSVDTLFYDIATISAEAGSFKGFDVLVIDPTHIISDVAVSFEMCEMRKIVTNFKNMAGMDYAAVVDTLTRQILVIAIDSPDARREIMKMKDAGECVAAAKAEYDAEVAEDEAKKQKDEKKEDEEEWQEFGDDADSNEQKPDDT